MTISTEVRKAGPFVGNGSASVFPFAFKVFKAADLIVVRRQDNIGEETTLVLDSDYHVTLNGNQDTTPGGVVTLVAGALASGFTLVVSSELPYLQPTDLTNQGGFYPKVITNALDRLTIFCQQLLEITGRTLKLPITAPTNISAEIPLPNPSELIAWDETGTRLTTVSPQSLVTSIAYGSATADLFAGDGVTTTFPLSANPASVNNLDVSVGGFSQRPVQGGIGDYSWNGGASITFASPPPAPAVPGDKNVLVRYMQAIPVSDSEALHAQTREALRRSYAEAGYNLVDGSFEVGGTLASTSDVLLLESAGAAYAWTGAYPGGGYDVAPGTNPSSGGFVDKSGGEGDELVSVQQPFAGAVARTQHDKNKELLSMADFTSASQAVGAVIAQTNATLFNNTNAITLTVGTGGQFATLLEALVAVQRMKPIWKHGNGYCTIRLNAGYVHDQQIRFDGGVDLSWVRITSQDSVVYCNTTAFTESVRTYYVNKYMFYILNKSKAPTFFVQFEENRNDSDVTAFVVTGGATLAFGPRSGARKFYVGIDGTYGADVIGLHNGSAPDPDAVLANLGATYYCCDFSYSRYTCARFIDGVTVSMPVSKFEYCQEATQQAVLCIYGVTANFHGSSASYSVGSGWNIRDGCHVNIRDHKTINCGGTGIASIHGAVIDARCHHTEEVLADTSGKVLDPTKRLGLYGCAVGVRCESAAIVEVAGTDIRNCGLGVNAATGATVSGKGCDLSDCTLAFEGYADATQTFPRLWAKNVGKLLLNQRGCDFSTWTAHISMNPASTQPSFIETWVGGESTFFEAEIDANTGVIARDGASIVFKSSILKVNALRSYYGSRMTLDNIDWDQGYKNSTPQLNISRGSFLNAQDVRTSDGALLTAGTTKNALTVSGAIFAALTNTFQIAMVGDSLTARGDWSGYFPTKSMGNFGYGGDTTAKILARMAPILASGATKVFIMAGTNDVTASVPTATIVANLINIADQVKASGKTPILQSTVLSGTARADMATRNVAINAINSSLVTQAAAKAYTYINLNAGLAPSGTLLDAYTADGIHLTDNGYQVWVGLINSNVLP